MHLLRLPEPEFHASAFSDGDALNYVICVPMVFGASRWLKVDTPIAPDEMTNFS